MNISRMTKLESQQVKKYQNIIFDIVKNVNNYHFYDPFTGQNINYSAQINAFDRVATGVAQKRHEKQNYVVSADDIWAIATPNIYKAKSIIITGNDEANKYYDEFTDSLNKYLGEKGKKLIRQNLATIEQIIKDNLEQLKIGINLWVNRPYAILEKNAGSKNPWQEYIDFWNEKLTDGWGDDSSAPYDYIPDGGWIY